MDNNFLATPKDHRERVYSMLRNQKSVSFNGGLESRRLTDWDAEQILSMPSLYTTFFACDTPAAIKPLRRAMEKLKALPWYKKSVYVLIKKDPEETPESALERVIEVLETGARPFVQVYRSPDEHKKISLPVKWRRVKVRFSAGRIVASAIKFMESGDLDGLRKSVLQDNQYVPPTKQCSLELGP
jgi:hypothetical protein